MIIKGLIKGTLLKRYKRFFVDVALETGETVVAHCPNTGSMKTLLDGSIIAYLLPNNDPKRKLKYTLYLLELSHGAIVCVNTQLPNHLVKEAIEDGIIPELSGYRAIKTEVKYGEENSRIDILLEYADTKAYVEVKNVTYLHNEDSGVAKFPDSVTSRGLKHLHELEREVKKGNRGVMFYLVNRTDAIAYGIAKEIDPAYADAAKVVQSVGVEVLPYKISVTEKKGDWHLTIGSKLEYIT
ncbi:MAG: DNA/RNA nuclease SfsA [Fibrobacterales bacterium]